jgi:hypothetical protein
VKIKSQRDFWSGLMFVTVGLGFAWGSLEYSFGSSARPGPAYFPFGLGLLLAVMGAAVWFASITVETEDGDRIGSIAWRPLIIITGAVVMFGFILPRLGMIASLPLLIVVSGRAAQHAGPDDWFLADLHQGPEPGDSAVADLHHRLRRRPWNCSTT